MKLSLDFVRTLPMNVAKTEFSSSLSTNLTDRFWTWVISGLTRFKLDSWPHLQKFKFPLNGRKGQSGGKNSPVFLSERRLRFTSKRPLSFQSYGHDQTFLNRRTVRFTNVFGQSLSVNRSAPYVCSKWHPKWTVHFLSITVYFGFGRLSDSALEFWYLRNVLVTIFYGNVREIGPSINTN